jgi:glutamate 5-kinase
MGIRLPVRYDYIHQSKKIVIKIGTKVLLNHYKNPDQSQIERLASDIVKYYRKGIEFSIVTSGAVGFGMDVVGLESRPTGIKHIQALASIGQNLLMQKWHQLFASHGIHVGQILLTYDIIENRQRYLHARDCLQSVLAYQAIPIVNENDSVAVDELKFGDNDTLSALTAILMDADLLILFSDIAGLYNKNPQRYPDARRISYLEKITEHTYSLIEDRQNPLTIGGMKSKLNAAERSTQMGTAVIIADGMKPDFDAIMKGEDIGTFFRPEKKYEKKRKRWIFFNHKIKGKIIVDYGAEQALVKHFKSLLPGGITFVEGQFTEGSIVGIYNPQHQMIGKGISQYSSEDIEKIKGQRTEDIRSVQLNNYYDEVIHRDNMIII